MQNGAGMRRFRPDLNERPPGGLFSIQAFDGTGKIAHMKAFDVAGAQDAVHRHLSGMLVKVDEIRRVHTQYF